MSIYTIRNWRDFQHYRDRNPPWIKLHFALLSSRDWVNMNDASRVLAVSCMLIASRNDGQIDGSDDGLDYLQRVAYLHRRPDLKPLIDSGFLEYASNTLASVASKALALDREEDLTESLTEKPPEKISAEPVNGSAVAFFPLADGSEYAVSKELLATLEAAYPAVDGPATLKEIRAWCVTNPRKRKTARGAPAFLNRWFEKVQNHG